MVQLLKNEIAPHQHKILCKNFLFRCEGQYDCFKTRHVKGLITIDIYVKLPGFFAKIEWNLRDSCERDYGSQYANCAANLDDIPHN